MFSPLTDTSSGSASPIPIKWSILIEVSWRSQLVCSNFHCPVSSGLKCSFIKFYASASSLLCLKNFNSRQFKFWFFYNYAWRAYLCFQCFSAFAAYWLRGKTRHQSFISSSAVFAVIFSYWHSNFCISSLFKAYYFNTQIYLKRDFSLFYYEHGKYYCSFESERYSCFKR